MDEAGNRLLVMHSCLLDFKEKDHIPSKMIAACIYHP